jgi:hypothetical protein
MPARILFILIAGFWLTMNVLLVRAQFGAANARAGEVPVQLVWKKILSAPDSSSLSVSYRGKNIGYCHGVTGVGEEWAGVTEENIPPRLKAGGGRLRLEGSLFLFEITNRVHFEFDLALRPDRTWRELTARINTRPAAVEIHSVAAEKTVCIVTDDGAERFVRVLPFSDLENPGALLREFAGPFVAGLLESMELPMIAPGKAPLAAGVPWRAWEDTTLIGHSQVRVYRLQTQLLDNYKIVLLVSRVGEILRIELPREIVLVNDQLGAPL